MLGGLPEGSFVVPDELSRGWRAWCVKWFEPRAAWQVALWPVGQEHFKASMPAREHGAVNTPSGSGKPESCHETGSR